MNKNLEEVIDKIDNIPANMATAIKISRMLNDINIKISDLTTTISTDTSLSTQLLKLSNSAYYGFSGKIASINDSIAKLGFNTIKSLVFVSIAQSLFNRQKTSYETEKGQIWRNAVASGIYAKYIAQYVNYKSIDAAFTGGLLRDIGKIIIHEYVGKSYDEIIEFVKTYNISFNEAEEQIIGFNHCQIGAELAKKWNFPKILIDSIYYHHNPQDIIEDPDVDPCLISIIHIADAITVMLGQGIDLGGMMYKLEPKTLDALGINDEEHLEQIVSNLIELEPEIESLIGN